LGSGEETERTGKMAMRVIYRIMMGVQESFATREVTQIK
jgi:hypothetical protein